MLTPWPRAPRPSVRRKWAAARTHCSVSWAREAKIWRLTPRAMGAKTVAQHDDKEQEAREKERKKVEKYRRTQVIRGVSQSLASAEGRQFLWELLRIGRWATNPFLSDPYKTAFNCGELNVGQQIMALIEEADPEGFMVLQQEQLNDRSIDPDSGTS